MESTTLPFEDSLEEITIVIGTETKTVIPCRVLMHSILKRTKNPVNFCLMEGESWTKLSSRKLGQGTGFSLMRWKIPEQLNYKGFAIYLDTDQLVFRDIAELWNMNVTYKDKPSSIYCTYQDDKWLKNSPNTSVMLIDCEKAKEDWMPFSGVEEYLEKDCPKRSRYVKIMHAQHLKTLPTKIPVCWNYLNIAKDDTAILHYTSENLQPWYNPKHPFKYLWEQEFQSAIADGIITKEEIKEQLKIFKPHTKTERGQGLHPNYRKYAA